MARVKDPYRNYNFKVYFGNSLVRFRSVSGLGVEVEEIEYREGGDPTTMRKIPGQATFPNVTFEQGISDDDELTSWFQQVHNINKSGGRLSPDDDFRRTVRIELFDASETAVKEWTLRYAWPCKLETEDLDAEDQGSVLIQTLELCHEGLVQVHNDL